MAIEWQRHPVVRRNRMNDTDRRFWPFRIRNSFLSAIGMLVGLLIILGVMKTYKLWPISEASDTAVLIGALIISLLPILLSLVDIIIERGGVFEAGGVKIDFSNVPHTGAAGFTVPSNIGVPGQAVQDSFTTNILDALKQATDCEVVIIDLEDGHAWWETRLLVLLAGAVKLGRPERLVFLGRDGGGDKRFQGWGAASKLLRRLLRADPRYPISYHKALAASRQWELVEPLGVGQVPVAPAWMQLGLSTQHTWMAFDPNSGLPNPLLLPQLLASDLGDTIESKEPPKSISLTRLEELFGRLLHMDVIDESWPADRQATAFFESHSPYMAVTRNREYLTLVSRDTLLNTAVRKIVENKPASS